MTVLNGSSLNHTEILRFEEFIQGTEFIFNPEPSTSFIYSDEAQSQRVLVQFPEAQTLDEDLDEVIRRWEDNQVISNLLGEGCRKMALMAMHDEHEQSSAYKFGKNFGLASALTQNIIDLYRRSENCNPSHHLPVLIFEKENRTSLSEDLFCSVNHHKVRYFHCSHDEIQ